jgi:hypothetical protein
MSKCTTGLFTDQPEYKLPAAILLNAAENGIEAFGETA